MSSIKFYDFLCMLLCGYLIVCLIFGRTIPFNESNLLIWLLCYVVGLIYHRILEHILVFMNYIECMSKRAYRAIFEENNAIDECTQENYIQAYYELMRANCLNTIPVLEAQAAFLRNMFLPLVWFAVASGTGCVNLEFMQIDNCVITTLIGFFCTIIPIVWFLTQYKIYYLVWEGKKYLKTNKF